MKETYGYAVKEYSRYRIRDFVARSFSGKKRRGLKILTMLGHENYDLEQIWDPLGVQRRNITNVERESKVLSLAGDRGVNNIEGELGNVICGIDGPFDVIYLDTVSPFTYIQREILREISGRGLLRNRGVLATNYLGKREGGYTKEWFVRHAKKYGTDELPVDLIKNDNKQIIGRSNIISRMITSIMVDGNLNRGPHPFVIGNSAYEAELTRRLEKLDVNVSELGDNPLALFHCGEGAPIVKDMISGWLSTNPVISRLDSQNAQVFKEAIFYQDINAYFSISQDRYRYIGDNGSPMLIDMNRFERLPLDQIGKLEFLSSGVELIPGTEDVEKYKSIVRKFVDGRAKSSPNGPVPRKFLGSSYKRKFKPKRKKSSLTKDDAIYLLREGIPIEEILETFNNFTKMQLAAFKAHLTMGTYEEN